MRDLFKKNDVRGFTLVELSIVIIIIGIVIAGIASGKSLIEQAKLTSVVRGMQQYQTAFNGFQARYGAMPGDMASASGFWPTGCTTSVDPLTCNGNGNGIIDSTNEGFLSWRHLTLAGLISNGVAAVPSSLLTASVDGSTTVAALGGSYQVAAGSGKGGGKDVYVTLTAGVNYPASNIEGFGYVVLPSIYTPFSLSTFSVTLGKLFSLGNVFNGGSLSPYEAFNLDVKLDDGSYSSAGLPVGAYSGIFRTGAGSNCSSELDNSYAISVTSAQCVSGLSFNEPGPQFGSASSTSLDLGNGYLILYGIK